MLTPMEAAQIAGRAGRFRNDGTFGVTADCVEPDEEMVRRIEAHEFEPLHYVEWRHSDLDFNSLDRLLDSLHTKRPTKRLRRIKGAEDEAALERLIAIPEIREAMKTRAQVRQLWDICQIPDFRNLTIDTHVKLLQDIYRMLVAHGGRLPDDFMAKRIARCDDLTGEVEQLSARLAHIRTWTYCAGKSSWMSQQKHWVNAAREVEDRLSDALHEKLTARFVDRRTSKLMKGIGADAFMGATIKDNGEVFVDEILIGRLEGLRFTRDENGSKLEAKAIDAAAQKAVGPEIDRRLTSLCGGTHAIFTLSDQGEVMWGGQAVGKIAPSGTVFTPDATLIGGELGHENLRHMAEDRMREFLRAEVQTHLQPLIKLKEFQEAEGTLPEAKGFAYTLAENHGAVTRRHYGQVLRNLQQEPRRQLRGAGVTFGHFNIYMPELIKPKPARLLSLLVAYGAGGDGKPFIPFAGVTSIPNEGDLASFNFNGKTLSLAGYRAVGPRIVRFDILNRLSNLIRDAVDQFDEDKKDDTEGGKFQIMQEMLALLGSSYEDTRGVLQSLNYVPVKADEPLTKPAPKPDPAPEPAPKPASQPENKDDASGPEAKLDAGAETKTPPKPDEPELTNIEGVSKRQIKKLTRRKRLNVYNHRVTHEDGTSEELPNLEYWVRKQNNRKGGAPRKFDKKPTKRRTRNYTQAPPKKGPSKQAKKFENSPFAALAALKGEPDKPADKAKTETTKKDDKAED